MATIDVSSAFRAKNNILRNLLGKGAPNEILTLRFFAPANDNSGGFTSIGATNTDWNITTESDAEGGQITEVLKIVEHPPATEEVLRRAVGVDVVRPDDSFERYTIQRASANRNPISREWTFTIEPSKRDKTPLRG